MDYMVCIGYGDHDTEELPVRGVADPDEAMLAAALLLASTTSEVWHIIDVLPIFPMPKGMH